MSRWWRLNLAPPDPFAGSSATRLMLFAGLGFWVWGYAGTGCFMIGAAVRGCWWFGLHEEVLGFWRCWEELRG